ncbi:MAG: hypothetical protein CL840_08145 [Crocinitomicaceae bacterium]|nr:hypothetical protein [Crocinitomicaceae bacterium]|tara:strand:- start:45711 stop:48926 length:3216 start_codon:yes stop_codon:yes gene_type:complete
MKDMNFRKLDIIGGWIAFAIATFVYVSTMEPTVSFWDCGEFIACSYKLQIGHPPGAPLFLMIGRFFSMWTAPEQAAYMVNLISALSSSFTILFLFWTISALGKKIVKKTSEEWNTGHTVAVLGSSLVGSLAYTFSDTFWFSAVEAEVYAMSSLFTAIVFWAILRWEQVSEEKGADHWLIFIAYLMGLSIGVHLLNLLAIPTIAFVYYFKKFKPSIKGTILTFLISVIILGFVQKGVIPGIVEMASKFELVFVNSLNLPFNTGAILHITLMVSALVFGIYLTHQKNSNKWLLLAVLVALSFLVGSVSTMGLVAAATVTAVFVMIPKINLKEVNTGLLCLTVIIIGYSSYTMVVVRSNANPPMDENDPENMFSLLSYLNREQYGAQPLAYGHYFNTPLDNKKPYIDGEKQWFRDLENGEYIVSDDKKGSVPNYAKEFMTVFPRMWSQEARHIGAYKSWSEFKGKPIKYRTVSGKTETIRKPKFMENLKFFFRHQVNWMYIRYFMWNFAGRQSDVQGHSNVIDGNWISGIGFLDGARLGSQKNLPAFLSDNKSRNKYYMLPFLLGLIGLFFQFNRSKRDFVLVTLLFFFTGMAIILYLNQYPYQPRERDYAYAGSFYAYTIWIGLGVMGIISFIAEKVKSNQVIAGGLATLICLVSVPGLMAKDNWDDHDRSNRYTALEFAKMYLDSCEKDAVLFTNGDNDTFPLWYVQEVEEYRTDVRVVNLSLLNTDWYINQMKRAAYDSKPTPFTIPEPKYRQGTRDYVPVIDRNEKKEYVDVKRIVEFVTNDKNKAMLGNQRRMNYSPTKLYSLKVDTQKVLTNGTVSSEKAGEVLPELRWSITKNFLLKKDILMLDLLAHFNWDRPVYFAITTGDGAYLGLKEYFQLEGLAYRLVPFKGTSPDGQTGYVNSAIMYDNLMNNFSYGNVKGRDVYVDHNILRMCMNLRNNFARCADQLLTEGKKGMAIEVLDKCQEEMPEYNVPYNYFMLPIAELYFKLDEKEKGKQILESMSNSYTAESDYYMGLKTEHYNSVKNNSQQAVSILYRVNLLSKQYLPDDELTAQIEENFKRLETEFSVKHK